MTRRYTGAGIRSQVIYSVSDIAHEFGAHPKTVLSWVKTGRLKVDKSRRPWLIRGADLRLFLGQRQRRAKVKLAQHQCFCLRCKLPQTPEGKMATYRPQSAETGTLRGHCAHCGTTIFKFVRLSDLDDIRTRLTVTIQTVAPRLVDSTYPPSNAPFTRPHEKQS